MRNAPLLVGALAVDKEKSYRESVPDTPVTTADGPRCAVVGVYCEALWWLRRELPSRAALCCRGYWADVEGEAS
jgi:hypothetical protein